MLIIYMKVLYFCNKWPRKLHSAGSQRIFSICGSFINLSHTITFMSPQPMTQPVREDLTKYPFDLKQYSKDSLISGKQKFKIALIDDYTSQQTVGYDLYNKSNKTIKILDLQDLHGLRQHRQNALLNDPTRQLIRKGQKMWHHDLNLIDLHSMQRSDLVITCSQFEYFYLKQTYPHLNLCYASFLLPTSSFRAQLRQLEFRPFKRRQHFVFIGNMNHIPNSDAVKVLIQSIWPLISKQLPQAQLHIYGSNFPAQLFSVSHQLANQKIILKGLMEDLETIGQYKCLIAPLRFGAGIKGKIIDSWFYHTPVVTTPIGSEGMFFQHSHQSMVDNRKTYFKEILHKDQAMKRYEDNIRKYYSNNKFGDDHYELNFGGLWKNYTYYEFAQSCINIHNNEKLWQDSRRIGAQTILKNHSQNIGETCILGMIADTQYRLSEIRNNLKYIASMELITPKSRKTKK